MSKDAVKFGRMSKKQKAKVASELKQKNDENQAAEYALNNPGAPPLIIGNANSTFNTSCNGNANNSSSYSFNNSTAFNNSSISSSPTSSSPTAQLNSGPTNAINPNLIQQQQQQQQSIGTVYTINGQPQYVKQEQVLVQQSNGGFIGQPANQSYPASGEYQQSQVEYQQYQMQPQPIQYQQPQPQQAIQPQYTSLDSQGPHQANVNQFNYDLAATGKSIFDAHSRTFCAYFDLNEMNRILMRVNSGASPSSSSSGSSSSTSGSGQEVQRILGLTKPQFYMELADKLTSCVQQIIDFSKMVPGFMQLQQDDQISLLKSGSYGIMLLYATQAYVPERNCFLYNKQALNVEQLLGQHAGLDEDEKYFIQENLEFIRQLKQFQLSSSEVALLSAIILFNPENMNLNDIKSIHHTHQRFIEILRMDMENNRPATATGQSSLEKQQMLQQLLNLITVSVRRLTQSHFELVKAFKIKNPHVEFPPLHRELFNVDYYVYLHNQQQQQQQQQVQLQQSQQSLASSNYQSQVQQQQHSQQQQQQHQHYQVKQEQLSISSPSSCSSSSSSSASTLNHQAPASLSPPNNNQFHQSSEQYFYNSSNNQMINGATGNTPNKQQPAHTQQHQAPSYYTVGTNGNQQYSGVQSTSPSSSSFSVDSYQTADSDSMLKSAHDPKHEPTFNSLNKVNAVALSQVTGNSGVTNAPQVTTVSISSNAMHNLSPSSSTSSISPPSYASLTSTYASLIKSEPMFGANSMSIGIDTV